MIEEDLKVLPDGFSVATIDDLQTSDKKGVDIYIQTYYGNTYQKYKLYPHSNISKLYSWLNDNRVFIHKDNGVKSELNTSRPILKL